MKFMRQVSDGEETLNSGKQENITGLRGPGAMAGAWAREFADGWDEDKDFASGSGKSSSWEEEFGKKFGGELWWFHFIQLTNDKTRSKSNDVFHLMFVAVGRESSAKQDPETVPEAALDDVTNRFWDKLQEQWSKMEQDHDWLSEFSDYADPFKVRKHFFLLKNMLRD